MLVGYMRVSKADGSQVLDRRKTRCWLQEWIHASSTTIAHLGCGMIVPA